MKISERIFDNSLLNDVKVSTNQCDFVKEMSTMDTIHAARRKTQGKEPTLASGFLGS